MAAPPLFGSITKPIPLVQLLKSRLPAVEVHLLNDVTAATWRYVPEELGDFCLLTVSTGIGNKVFAGGRILLTAEGRGGEIGHLCVDTSVDAPPCDCGGRGHIGAFSSGRGAEALARRRAQLAPGEFSRSRLCEAVNGEANSIDALNLAQSAIAGDEFSLAIVRQSQLPLAIGIASIQASIGIERFIFMGGFALALGDLYRQILAGHLRQLGLFGIPDEEIDRMLILGHNDDLHGLLGAALFLVANQ
jgi:glucokinase